MRRERLPTNREQRRTPPWRQKFKRQRLGPNNNLVAGAISSCGVLRFLRLCAMTVGLGVRRTIAAFAENGSAAEKSRGEFATTVVLAARRITAASAISGLVGLSITRLCAITVGLAARRISVPR